MRIKLKDKIKMLENINILSILALNSGYRLGIVTMTISNEKSIEKS